MSFGNWIERWICCGRVDDEDIVDAVRSIRRNPEGLAESMVEYTHDAIEHHISTHPAHVTWVNNELLEEGVFTVEQAAAAAARRPIGALPEEGSDAQPASMPVVTLDVTARGVALECLVAEIAGRVSPVPEVDSIDSGIKVWMLGDMQVVVPASHPDVHPVPSNYVPTEGDVLEGHWPCQEKPEGGECSSVNCKPHGPFQKPAVEVEKKQDKAAVGDGPSSVYRVCQDVVEVKAHRRLPFHPHARGEYAASVVSEIKNRLGCPAPNAANLLAARRLALNAMCKHGVRPTHQREVIEKIIAGVFIPDENDLVGAKMLASVATANLRAEVSDAGPRSAWYELFHPFKNRGAARVRGGV